MSPVENYIYKQASNQQKILIFFHKLLTDQLGVTAMLKWGIPMYSANNMIAYLNKDQKSTGVHFCFYNGIQLAKKNSILDIKGRKKVASILIENIDTIPFEEISNCIQDAIALDKEIHKTKKIINGI